MVSTKRRCVCSPAFLTVADTRPPVANYLLQDDELMSSPGFSLEQLMELAGLSVAEAVYDVVVVDVNDDDVGDDKKKKHALLVCG